MATKFAGRGIFAGCSLSHVSWLRRRTDCWPNITESSYRAHTARRSDSEYTFCQGTLNSNKPFKPFKYCLYFSYSTVLAALNHLAFRKFRSSGSWLAFETAARVCRPSSHSTNRIRQFAIIIVQLQVVVKAVTQKSQTPEFSEN